MNRFKASKGIWLLAALAIVVWLEVLHFYIFQKTSFLDDAFIYLHIANNVLDTGTARFFPIADNPALIASSPLRLLFLMLPTAVVRLVHEPERGIEAARLTFYLYGVLVSLLFLLFHRRQVRMWLWGVVFAGVIARSTETGLQMEGLLLFWCVFTWLAMMMADDRDERFFRRLGYIGALLMLTRPEYGLVALVLMAVYTALQRSVEYAVAFVLPVLICGVGWMVLASLLRVFPIPTSYLTKVLTAELRLFSGGTFWDALPSRARYMFLHGISLPPVAVTAFPCRSRVGAGRVESTFLVVYRVCRIVPSCGNAQCWQLSVVHRELFRHPPDNLFLCHCCNLGHGQRVEALGPACAGGCAFAALPQQWLMAQPRDVVEFPRRRIEGIVVYIRGVECNARRHLRICRAWQHVCRD